MSKNDLTIDYHLRDFKYRQRSFLKIKKYVENKFGHDFLFKSVVQYDYTEICYNFICKKCNVKFQMRRDYDLKKYWDFVSYDWDFNEYDYKCNEIVIKKLLE